MPTLKDRINITVEPELYSNLAYMASRKHQSIAGYTKALVEKALELEEDNYFSVLSDKRIGENQPVVDHKDAWK